MMDNPFGGMFRYQTPQAPYGYQGGIGRDHALEVEQSQLGFGGFGGNGLSVPQPQQTQWAYTQVPNPFASQSPNTVFNNTQSNYQSPLGNLLTQPQRQTGMRSIWTGGY